MSTSKRDFRRTVSYTVLLEVMKKSSCVAIIKEKYGCDPSSVIKIVKMKYNRIDIKC
jgi:hypothetical protein